MPFDPFDPFDPLGAMASGQVVAVVSDSREGIQFVCEA